MDEIKALLKRRAVFHCSPRGGELGSRDFEIVHSVRAPVSEEELQDWMPPSHRSVLIEFGALELFQPEEHGPDGFRLFTPAECNESLALFLQTIENAAELLDEDELNQSVEAENWSKNLRPIGEVVESGDLFAIDTMNRRKNGECPVVFLDHEYYFGGWLDPEDTEVVAASVLELLVTILKDPLPYLDACWAGNDPNQQWFPDSVTFPDS